MKEKIKTLICSLPMSIKTFFTRVLTVFNIKKSIQLSKLKKMESEDFSKLNSNSYKKNLRKCLSQFLISTEDTEKYIKYLYYDKLELINEAEFDFKNPTIICVVKNEYYKLINFFEHYNRIGKFNYLFIDNNSTDGTLELLKNNKCKVFLCKEKFSTLRKTAWIGKAYSILPNDCWTVLLDADELLAYQDYEKISFNEYIELLEEKKVKVCGAIMVDLFPKKITEINDYIKEYKYFQNTFEKKKSYLFNSVYGGIREREFKYTNDRIFLIKKHPVLKKSNQTLLIHCHYVYPFDYNEKSEILIALLHYKLFNNEINKYKKIAEEGSYGNGGGSKEYKMYLNKLNNNSFDEIFKFDDNTVEYNGTESLKKIKILKNVNDI